MIKKIWKYRCVKSRWWRICLHKLVILITLVQHICLLKLFSSIHHRRHQCSNLLHAVASSAAFCKQRATSFVCLFSQKNEGQSLSLSLSLSLSPFSPLSLINVLFGCVLLNITLKKQNKEVEEITIQTLYTLALDYVILAKNIFMSGISHTARTEVSA